MTRRQMSAYVLGIAEAQHGSDIASCAGVIYKPISLCAARFALRLLTAPSIWRILNKERHKGGNQR